MTEINTNQEQKLSFGDYANLILNPFTGRKKVNVVTLYAVSALVVAGVLLHWPELAFWSAGVATSDAFVRLEENSKSEFDQKRFSVMGSMFVAASGAVLLEGSIREFVHPLHMHPSIFTPLAEATLAVIGTAGVVFGGANSIRGRRDLTRKTALASMQPK